MATPPSDPIKEDRTYSCKSLGPLGVTALNHPLNRCGVVEALELILHATGQASRSWDSWQLQEEVGRSKFIKWFFMMVFPLQKRDEKGSLVKTFVPKPQWVKPGGLKWFLKEVEVYNIARLEKKRKVFRGGSSIIYIKLCEVK